MHQVTFSFKSQKKKKSQAIFKNLCKVFFYCIFYLYTVQCFFFLNPEPLLLFLMHFDVNHK